MPGPLIRWGRRHAPGGPAGSRPGSGGSFLTAGSRARRPRLRGMRPVTQPRLLAPQGELELGANGRVRRIVRHVPHLVRIGLEVVELPLRRVVPVARARQAEAVVVEVDDLVAVGAVAVVR